MNDAKYIGMDVHQATICAAVRDSSGNLVMEATLETKAETILEFVRGLRGSLRVSFEEGTCASWLHDLLQPHVSEVLVCDSRKNALLRVGNKNDREDARKLSELLFLNKLHAVYHGEAGGIRTLKELARSYLTITRDLTRVMNRLKAIYRGWGIACAGQHSFGAELGSFACLVRPFRFGGVSGVDHVLLMLDTEDSRTMGFKFDDCFIQLGQPKTINPLKLPHKVRTSDPKRQLCRGVS